MDAAVRMLGVDPDEWVIYAAVTRAMQEAWVDLHGQLAEAIGAHVGVKVADVVGRMVLG